MRTYTSEELIRTQLKSVSVSFGEINSENKKGACVSFSVARVYVHYSLSKFTGEWFTNRSNHIHRFTPITRIVATKHLTNAHSKG